MIFFNERKQKHLVKLKEDMYICMYKVKTIGQSNFPITETFFTETFFTKRKIVFKFNSLRVNVLFCLIVIFIPITQLSYFRYV